MDQNATGASWIAQNLLAVSPYPSKYHVSHVSKYLISPVLLASIIRVPKPIRRIK